MEIPLTAEQVRVLRKHQAAYQQALQAAVLQREYLAGLAMFVKASNNATVGGRRAGLRRAHARHHGR